jgi:hypothetical protein
MGPRLPSARLGLSRIPRRAPHEKRSPVAGSTRVSYARRRISLYNAENGHMARMYYI